MPLWDLKRRWRITLGVFSAFFLSGAHSPHLLQWKNEGWKAVWESSENLACNHLTHPLKRSSQSQPLQRSCSTVCLWILKIGSFCEHWIFGNCGRQQLLRLVDAGWYAQVPIPAYSLLLQSGEFSPHMLLNWGEINKQNVPSANSEGKTPSSFTDRSKITVYTRKTPLEEMVCKNSIWM